MKAPDMALVPHDLLPSHSRVDGEAARKPPRPFVTVFRDHTGAAITTAKRMSMADLERIILAAKPKAKKAGLSLLKFAKFGDKVSGAGSYRTDENVVEVSGIEGDCDDDTTPMAGAVQRLRDRGVAALFYTSPSHKPGGAGRWRVLCPLAKPITEDLDRQHQYWVGVMNAILDGTLKSESFTLSQAYYFGRIKAQADPEIERLEGVCIDELTTLPTPDYGTKGVKPIGPRAASDVQPLTESQIDRLLAQIPADDYHSWIAVGQILRGEYDDEPDRWIAWSKKSPKFKSEDDCRKKWLTFNGKGLTAGTLIRLGKV